MKGQEICNVVKDYIENRPYPYAIMIDGEWGSGKSYFLKHELKDFVEKLRIEDSKKEKTYRIINISLYGISSVKEISDQIATHLIFKRFGKTGKALINTTSSILSALSEKYIGTDILPSQTEDKIIEKLQDVANIAPYIFVFDDLERCQMSVNEILGYINNLVENSYAKVIIVANEKEISSINIQQNKELKYLLCLNNGIEFPQMPNDMQMLNSMLENIHTNAKVKKEKSLELSEIQFRLNLLFGTDELYNKVKEKLIGQTIEFEPDIENVIPSLVKSYLAKENPQCQEAIGNDIISKINALHVSNLRTVQSVLSLAQKFMPLLSEYNDQKILNEMRRYIITKAMETAFLVTKGEDPNKQKDSLNIFRLEKNHKHIDKIIQQYFSASSFVVEDVKIALQTLYTEVKYQIDKSEDPINSLERYYISSEQEVISLYEGFRKKIMDNEYESGLYPKVLGILCDLQEIEVIEKEDFQKCLKNMKENIENGRVIEQYDGIIYAQVSTAKEKYKECYQELYRVKQNEKSHSDAINGIITSGDGWSYKLDDYIAKLIPNTLTNILCIIDVKILIEILYQSTSNEISNFRRVFYKHCDHTEKESDKISELIQELDPKKGKDKINKLQLEWLKSNLQEIK